jgi:hypothetical protein
VSCYYAITAEGKALRSESMLVVLGLALAAAVVAFSIFAVALYRFLRFVWVRLPQFILSGGGPVQDRIVGVIVALVIFPSIAVYIWNATTSVFEAIPDLIRNVMIVAYESAGACSVNAEDCLRTVTAKSVTLFGGSAKDLLSALQIKDFPIRDFIIFLLAAVIVTGLIGHVRVALQEGRTQIWWRRAKLAFISLARAIVAVSHRVNRAFTVDLRDRLAYAALICISFYLGLCALLAIPLFQNKSESQQFTVEALDKALDVNIGRSELFEKAFPATLPPLSEARVVSDSGFASAVGRRLDFIRSQLVPLHMALQDTWSVMRERARLDLAQLKEQTKQAFVAAKVSRVGSRETAEHYNILFLWHQNALKDNEVSLRTCLKAGSTFIVDANLGLAKTKEAFEEYQKKVKEAESKVGDTEVQAALKNVNFDWAAGVTEKGQVAVQVCQPETDGNNRAIPVRPPFGSSLGPVASLAGWLLKSESVPVVIIVGLVGFSLLGAAVSRLVRVNESGRSARLTANDLFIVLAGGTTAAIVVFLAAYGGLAVLGNVGGDPNPYIVFLTCLVGAVYSEDVWRWARANLLKTDRLRKRPSKSKARRK